MNLTLIIFNLTYMYDDVGMVKSRQSVFSAISREEEAAANALVDSERGEMARFALGLDKDKSVIVYYQELLVGNSVAKPLICVNGADYMRYFAEGFAAEERELNLPVTLDPSIQYPLTTTVPEKQLFDAEMREDKKGFQDGVRKIVRKIVWDLGLNESQIDIMFENVQQITPQ